MMSGVNVTSGRKQRDEDAAAHDAALLALHLTHTESTLLFLMVARQGATDAQIANALGGLFLPHLTDPGYLEDRVASIPWQLKHVKKWKQQAAAEGIYFQSALDNFQSALAVLECEPRLPEGLHALHLQLLDGMDKGKEADGKQKKTCTTVQAADTPPSLLAADTFDLLQFLNKLLVFPADDWSRTWAADRTMMLRMTSKEVRDAMDKLCLPTTVKMRKSFLHNLVNFASGRRTTPLLKSQKSVCKTIALKRKRMQHIFTQLDS